MSGDCAFDRRAVSLGVAATLGAGLAPARAQLAGIEVLAGGQPGDGSDQIARAVAEGFGPTELVPRAIAVDVPSELKAFTDFVEGRRPRTALMVVGLSTVGVLLGASADARLERCLPMALLAGERQPIVVPAASPFKSIGDLMKALQSDSSAVSWGGRDRFGADHQLCLELTRLSGGDTRRVDYRGFTTSAEASTRALTGKLAVATGALQDFLQQIRGGTMRALALASSERAPVIDVPTLRELGVDIAQSNWRGLVSRSATGSALIGRFEMAIPRVVRSEGWRQMLSQRHWEDLYQPPEGFQRHIAAERVRVARLLRDGGAL